MIFRAGCLSWRGKSVITVRDLSQAPAKTMNVNYLMFHTMDPEMAVEDLKEIYRQKRGV